MIGLEKSNPNTPADWKNTTTKQTPYCIGISETEHFIPTPHPGHAQSLTV